MRPKRIVRVVGPNKRRSSAGACAGVGGAHAVGAAVFTGAGAATSSGMLVAVAAGAYNSLGTGAAAGSSALSAVTLGAATSTGAAAGFASVSGAGAAVTRGVGTASGVGAVTGSADGSEPIAPTILGMNTDDARSYSSGDVVRNKCHNSRWFYRKTDGTTSPVTSFSAEGWPLGPYPSGYTQLYNLTFENAKGTGRTGIWEFVPSSACTMTFSSLSNATAGAITTTSALLTTGATGSFNAGIIFNVTSIPVDGFSARCVLQSDADPTNLIAPQAVADWTAAQFGPDGFIWRDMKYSGAEDASTTPVYRPFYTQEFAVSFCNQTGADLWHNIAWSENLTTQARPFLEYFRDNAAPTALLYGEVANEAWNYGYAVQFSTLATAAFNAGHWAGGTIGATLSNENYPVANVHPFNGVTSRVFQPGEWFFCRTVNYAWAVVEVVAAGDVAAGVIVPATGSNSNFAVRATFNSIYDTLRRYLTVLQVAYAQLGYEVLGSRFKSVLGVSPNDSPSSMSSWLRYQNGHLNIDHYANTGYSGSGATFASLPWAVKHTDDFATFKAGWIAKRRAKTDIMIANRVSTKNGVWSQLAAAGVAPADRPTQIFYETGDHNTIVSVPPGDQAGVVAAIILCKQSAEEYAETMHHLTEMKTKLGGVNVLFASVDVPFYNSAISQAQNFGWLMNQRGLRTGEQGYNALLDFAATL